MARLHIHPFGLGLIFFGLLSWVIALGGMAASSVYCGKQVKQEQEELAARNITSSLTAPAASCANAYQLEWWTIWFEFFLLLIMLLTCFTNAFDRGRFIYLTYLAMVTVQLTTTATNFISKSFTNGVDFSNRSADALNAVAVGAVMLCIINYALIIFIGLGATSPAQSASPAGYTPGFSLAALGIGNSSAGYANPNQQQSNMGVGGSSDPQKYQPSNF